MDNMSGVSGRRSRLFAWRTLKSISRTCELHVFTRLRESSLKMKPRKCSFAMEQRYLGHLVSADGLTVDPRKVEPVRELATPSNRSELRSFLGLASY